MSAVLSTEVSTLPELLATRSREIGDEPFLRYADVRWTYGEFAGRVAEVAGGLRAAGVKRGDVVGVVLRNGPEYLEVWWAILWLGATFNPVNPDLTGREAAQILGDSGATTVVCNAEAAAALEAHRDELPALRQLIAVTKDTGDPLASLRGDGSVDQPRGDRARRPGRARLHLRHHRQAEGRDARATPTSWPTPGCSPSCCRSGAATCWAWCCRCST